MYFRYVMFFFFACMVINFAHATEDPKTIYIIPCCINGNPFNAEKPMFVIPMLIPALQAFKQASEWYGYTVKIDFAKTELSDVAHIILFDIPVRPNMAHLTKHSKARLSFIPWEPPSVRPRSYESVAHSFYSHVFTWHDDLIDNNVYFKICYPYPFLSMIDPVDFSYKKFCTLINANKGSHHPDELYSERINAIEFFECYAPQDFDLYGYGWDACNYQCFKGIIPNIYRCGLSKIQVLKQYKFCICYENMSNINGYVTEKIFDCFHAGVVPVYGGAANISRYIPRNCFIAREDFDSYEALYHFLASMSKATYEEYLASIRKYLASAQAFIFSNEYFVDALLRHIIPAYKPEDIFDESILLKLAAVKKIYQ